MTEHVVRTVIICLNAAITFLASFAVVARRHTRKRHGESVRVFADHLVALCASDIVLSLTIACGLYAHAGQALNWRVWGIGLGSLLNLYGLGLLARFEADEVTRN